MFVHRSHMLVLTNSFTIASQDKEEGMRRGGGSWSEQSIYLLIYLSFQLSGYICVETKTPR